MQDTHPYKWLLFARGERNTGQFSKGRWLQSAARTPREAIEQIVEEPIDPFTSDDKRAFIEAAKSSGYVSVYPIHTRRDFELLTREQIVVETDWQEI